MSLRPAAAEPARHAAAHLAASAGARVRPAPVPGRLARRRLVIFLTKLLLPVCALALLAIIAVWPELDREAENARFAFRRMSGEVEGASLFEAQYHGVDEHNRPYTLTAAIARQITPERIDLSNPKGDITLENGRWMMIQSKQGSYLRRASQLDLAHEVTVYRDDGLTLTTESASVDLRGGAASSAEPTHAEGPFGTLDAAGFTLLDKGATIQFTGPAHVVLNGASP